jgi:hypothetical protein
MPGIRSDRDDEGRPGEWPDPELRRIADNMICSQQSEIKELRLLKEARFVSLGAPNDYDRAIESTALFAGTASLRCRESSL